MVVSCDKCGKSFKIKKHKRFYKISSKYGRLSEHYFSCPYCQTEYPFLYTSQKVEAIQKQINKEQKQQNPNQDKIAMRQKQLEVVLKDIKKEVENGKRNK